MYPNYYPPACTETPVPLYPIVQFQNYKQPIKSDCQEHQIEELKISDEGCIPPIANEPPANDTSGKMNKADVSTKAD